MDGPHTYRPGNLGAGRSIAPTLRHRLADLAHPRWARTALARRILAGLLLLLAVALYLRGDPDSERVSIVVAAHDLSPGRVVTTEDLRSADLESGVLPQGTVRDADKIVGHTLAGATRAGEVITDVRVLGPRLAVAATGASDSRVVPIRLADAAVADLLREGDRVDVLMATDRDTDHQASPGVLATDAAVVLVSRPSDGRAGKEHVVMLALPAEGAAKVAAASLDSALTVIFH